jgi:hypothetical protein
MRRSIGVAKAKKWRPGAIVCNKAENGIMQLWRRNGWAYFGSYRLKMKWQ